MKILNYSTWYLLFTTIMQAASGYTCPNITEINKKIDAKEPMRFPLIEGDRTFWRHKNLNNQIEKFYEGTARTTEIGGIYYLAPPNSTLMCIYKKASQAMFFSLAAAKKRVNEVNASSIIGGENWVPFDLNLPGTYSCGDDNQPKENIENCQFNLKISR